MLDGTCTNQPKQKPVSVGALKKKKKQHESNKTKIAVTEWVHWLV